MSAATYAQTVSWWSVHEFVDRWLVTVDDWPLAGTPEWCQLSDTDPRKWCALLDAAQHWSLRIETCQESRAEASRAIAGAVDWPKLANELTQLRAWRAARPWSKRVTA